MRQDTRSRFGFTMIEILVVVAIIALLTTIGIISYTATNRRARDGKRRADLEQIRSALVLYRTDNGEYPESLDWDTMAPISTYISGTAIRDPLDSPYPPYDYTSDSSTFTVCATLESTTPSVYCLSNP